MTIKNVWWKGVPLVQTSLIQQQPWAVAVGGLLPPPSPQAFLCKIYICYDYDCKLPRNKQVYARQSSKQNHSVLSHLRAATQTTGFTTNTACQIHMCACTIQAHLQAHWLVYGHLQGQEEGRSWGEKADRVGCRRCRGPLQGARPPLQGWQPASAPASRQGRCAWPPRRCGTQTCATPHSTLWTPPPTSIHQSISPSILQSFNPSTLHYRHKNTPSHVQYNPTHLVNDSS